MNDYKPYYRAIESALICWDIAPTGNAKEDLNNLLCIEHEVILNPECSLDARILQKETAYDCLKIMSYNLSFKEAEKKIKERYGIK